MAEPCGSRIGHEDCNYQFTVDNRPSHVADNNSWTRTKSIRYKQKMIKQQKITTKK